MLLALGVVEPLVCCKARGNEARVHLRAAPRATTMPTTHGDADDDCVDDGRQRCSVRHPDQLIARRELVVRVPHGPELGDDGCDG